MAELERAGVGLVLAAEAAGRLREQHRFLYAAAEDLRVADVPALLAGYKVGGTCLVPACFGPCCTALAACKTQHHLCCTVLGLRSVVVG